MKILTIKKTDWEKGVDAARQSYRLFGPVLEDNMHVIRELDENQYPDLGYIDTVLSFKSILFPQSENILTASLNENDDNHHIFARPPADYSPRAVIGIRPYDAKAVELVKMNFDTEDYRDPYWCDAYEATTLIGLAVNQPGIYDFSTTAGSGPFDEDGLDLLLIDHEDEYLCKVITPKGEAYAEACGIDAPADSNAAQLIEQMKAEAQDAIQGAISTDKLQSQTILNLYEAPFWEDVAFSCINCGTCTYVCPTCWCFDIQDETKRKSTIRMRNWDTCMSSLFTHHASGHNPRSEKVQRVRQRFMHKLKYFFDKYDKGTMCVGCGRCVKHCPVNIDIREVCNMMNDYVIQE